MLVGSLQVPGYYNVSPEEEEEEEEEEKEGFISLSMSIYGMPGLLGHNPQFNTTCTILQIASLFHMSYLTPVFRTGFLKSIRLIRNGFLTLYSVWNHYVIVDLVHLRSAYSLKYV